ncbi:hypothetical protein DQ04_05721000, partial [Trypanosoma grayi]|uniref:hypothetical protein n=1 Tax=Trypanosoma grayi TaxID=71804 RepID=UPI0004F47AF4
AEKLVHPVQPFARKGTQALPQGEQEQEQQQQQTQVLEKKEADIGVGEIHALNTVDGAARRNVEANAARWLESQHKADEQRQALSAGDRSLTEELKRERRDAEVAQQQGQEEKVEAQDIHAIQEEQEDSEEVTAPKPDVGTNQNGAAASTSEGTKASDVLYGNWKELRQKETGRLYYRNILTKEAVWKPPPEVLEMKQQSATHPTQPEQHQGMGVVKKGAIRVSGVWKEFRDPKSGRLYYVNSETKQRTWKVEETPFLNE